MATSTRCKFQCESVTKNQYAESAKLFAVGGGTPEDNQFSEASPSGNFEIYISNKAVHGFFVPGEKYYFDITPAPDPKPELTS